MHCSDVGCNVDDMCVIDFQYRVTFLMLLPLSGNKHAKNYANKRIVVSMAGSADKISFEYLFSILLFC